MSPVIQVEDLCKSFYTRKREPGTSGAFLSLFTRAKTEVKAVDKVNFSLEPGEFVGFLGPNGAGKTTTIKMLSGILYPSSGSVRVLGENPFQRKKEFLRRISLVMGNKMQLWWDLPAQDSFDVMQALYEIPRDHYQKRLKTLTEELMIADKIQTAVRKLSLGERMKCELVAALLHQPDVLFLDEPTLGLDIISQKRIREFLAQLNKEEGSTILLTSHYMQDVQELCKRVIVIDHGTCIFDGTLESLSSKYQATRRVRLTLSHAVEPNQLEGMGEVIENNDCIVTLDVPTDQIASVASNALAKLPVQDIAIEDVDIESVIARLFSR